MAPFMNEWGWTASSIADGTAPVSAWGTSVTPAQNAYGSYASAISGANLTYDVWEITIGINTVGISAAARDCLVSFGVDPAGGTAFTSVTDLVAGPASQHTSASGVSVSGGTSYTFPFRIAAGSSVGFAASVNSATLTAINVWCVVRGLPSRPEQVRAGTYIDSFGVSTTTSAGTTVTPGTASEGAYAQMGSTLTRPCWFWEFGMGINDTTMNNATHSVDIAIGDGSNYKVVIPNAVVRVGATEVLAKSPSGSYGQGAVGDGVYARTQCNGVDSATSIAVYGVGG